ncbi:cation-transporting P-type ATPase [candidate division FCPU426 bacterium]|nr:cation-transporting P-type ATPase [candidate division FCPU426 bacterium]
METLISHHWHELPEEEVLGLLETRADQGLSGFEIKHRQGHFGLNQLTPKKKTSPVKRFLLQFHNPLVYILLSAAAVTALLSEWVDFSVIFGVVFVNALIGFFQEAKAEEAIESLRRSVATVALLLRDGQKERIKSQDIVPGDIVILESGDKVPADLRLLRARDLRIDESTLTGESLPIEKNVAPLSRDTVLADRTNMAYSGSLVANGRGLGVVVGIGDNTETGRISSLISQAANLETPLTRKITVFSRNLLWVIMGLAVLTFAVGLFRREAVFEMFMAAVALAVGAIPEGLPAAVTITLAIGVNRLAKRRAIIRKLPAVETLGSTTVICSDKTGTLTENQMTVQAVWAGGRRFSIGGQGYTPEGKITAEGKGEPVRLGDEPALRESLLAGMLCNDAKIRQEEGVWRIQGDPTEAALLVSARKAGLNEEEENKRLPRLDTIPFESDRQYMATLHDTGPDLPNILYIKGAVEKILPRSVKMLGAAGDKKELDEHRISAAAADLARKGWRVLALARKDMGNREENLECVENTVEAAKRVACGDLTSGLTFIGLQAMIDPPRPEAVRAVAACYKAGVQVKMITGDHALTATAIAEQLGLKPPGGKMLAKTGRELEDMSDRELVAAASEASVFARVAPEQKLKLVDALQSLGNVVAMTGDGVNDAPALKQADIGVAMGVSGTEVAKEAADMVLTDDNFATIEAAVEEGRGVFDNLTKFIVWTLPTNLGEGLVILAAILIGTALPILPVQILWINMTTALLLGLTLAFEPKEPGIMERPPRDPKTPIITTSLIWRIILVAGIMLIGAFGLFKWEITAGGSTAQARTAAVNIFVLVEMLYLFNCRSLEKSILTLGFFSNLFVIAGSGVMLALQLLFTYLPVMNKAFGSAPIGLKEWGIIAAFALLTYTLVEGEKWVRRKKKGFKHG